MIVRHLRLPPPFVKGMDGLNADAKPFVLLSKGLLHYMGKEEL